MTNRDGPDVGVCFANLPLVSGYTNYCRFPVVVPIRFHSQLIASFFLCLPLDKNRSADFSRLFNGHTSMTTLDKHQPVSIQTSVGSPFSSVSAQSAMISFNSFTVRPFGNLFICIEAAQRFALLAGSAYRDTEVNR